MIVDPSVVAIVALAVGVAVACVAVGSAFTLAIVRHLEARQSRLIEEALDKAETKLEREEAAARRRLR